MPAVVVDYKVKIGDEVSEGEPLVVLSAMKMETVLPAPCSGKVTRVLHNAGDQVYPTLTLTVYSDCRHRHRRRGHASRVVRVQGG